MDQTRGMDEHRDPLETGATPEADDSGNPTLASPDVDAEPQDPWLPGSSTGSSDQVDENTAPGGASAAASSMIGQLQTMIDNITRQAEPVVRDVAAKAAELAAVAAERAGPLVQKAAERTQQVGERVAARSRDFAGDMRRPSDPGADMPAEPMSGSASAEDEVPPTDRI